MTEKELFIHGQTSLLSVSESGQEPEQKPDAVDPTNPPEEQEQPEKPNEQQQRFAALKTYMRVDFDDDDRLIAMLLAVADSYLDGAGIDRSVSAAMYDLAAFHMTLALYDGRESDADHAAATPAVRQIINQLKIRCATVEKTMEKDATDDSTQGGGTQQPDNGLCAEGSY